MVTLEHASVRYLRVSTRSEFARQLQSVSRKKIDSSFPAVAEYLMSVAVRVRRHVFFRGQPSQPNYATMLQVKCG